jgi:beta-N-acetylhexosaminidase
MVELTLKEKIGQLMVFGFDGTTPTAEILELIRDYKVGGIILFGRNIGTPYDVLSLTQRLHKEAFDSGHPFPLLICTDQENGVVRRLGKGSTIFPGAMLLGATGQPELAREVGAATGKELNALGINWNLSPVLDVNNNPLNPVIGVRSFGENPSQVSALGGQIMKGMQEAGIMTTLKHFPGHGDTDTDSHLDLPTIPHSIERLEEIELKPFKDCINQGADTVMTAHVYFPAFEKREGVPATISKDVITGLLRNRLQFSGVVTTDCLEMNAIKDTIGTPRGAVEALKAGVDLIMISHTYSLQAAALEEIFKAVESGELEETVIDEAYNRVIKLKEKYLSFESLHLNGEGIVPEVVGCKEHWELAERVCRQGVTVVKNDGILPLSNETEKRILILYPDNSSPLQVEDKRYSGYSLGQAVQNLHTNTESYCFLRSNLANELSELAEKAKDYDVVIIGTMNVKGDDPQIQLVKQINNVCEKTMVIALRNPYDLSFFPEIPCYIATYEYTEPALAVAAKVLFGIEKAEGKLPVTIS